MSPRPISIAAATSPGSSGSTASPGRKACTILATNHVHYHAPERRPLQDVMTCIREKVTLANAGHLLSPNAERHLKSPQEMARLFERWPHAIAATRDFADALHFSLDELRYEYPRESVPEGRSPQQYLEHLTWAGAKQCWPDGVPAKVEAQLRHELALIDRLDFARYFLTVHDIVAFARSLDPPILCQGRGSAANSAVCYCLGITAVDPATSDLLFERFISEERKEPPDIDVDFEHERREEVIQHIYAKYGRDRAGIAATVIHYRPRSAIREVGKAMGLSEDVTAAIASTHWGSMDGVIEDDRVSEAGLDFSDPHLKRVIKLASQMIGMPRHLSQHVGGFILTERPLTETVPVGNGAMDDRTFIEWDKDDIEELGILKIDVLALGMLTCCRKAFDLIEQHHGERFELATVPREVPAVYDMLCTGDSLGVFQVESRAQMNMLPRLKPRCFYDLVIEVAIVRPGPIQGDMVHPYLKRRSGKEAVCFPCPSPDHGPPDELERILARTLGVPVFQEQAMKIALDAARFSPAEANQLRKAMATFRSRGTIDLLQDKMVGRMVARGYDEDFAMRCFHQIRGFGEYGFPESHAASFAHLVYVSSWIRWKYPAAFACALLNSQPMGFYAPAQIVRDARDHGVEVLAVDVNHSDWDCTLGDPSTPCRGMATPALRLGLRQVEGLRKDDSERIVAARGTRPFADVEEVKTRGRVGVATIERLAAADAFRSIGLDRRAALWDARALKQAPDLPLFIAAEERDEGAEESPAILPQMPLAEHVVNDYQTVRLSLKAHPMSFLRDHYESRGLRHRRPASRPALRPAGQPCRARPHPPAAGQRQGRVLHHARGRDRNRQSDRLARPLRGAALDRHGRPADGRPRRGPARRSGGPCHRRPARGRHRNAAPFKRRRLAFDPERGRRRRGNAQAADAGPSARRPLHPQKPRFPLNRTRANMPARQPEEISCPLSSLRPLHSRPRRQRADRSKAAGRARAGTASSTSRRAAAVGAERSLGRARRPSRTRARPPPSWSEPSS